MGARQVINSAIKCNNETADRLCQFENEILKIEIDYISRKYIKYT